MSLMLNLNKYLFAGIAQKKRLSSSSSLEKSVNRFEINNEDNRTTLLMSFWCLIVNFEDISHLFQLFLLLT